jgi:hypothetical protein
LSGLDPRGATLAADVPDGSGVVVLQAALVLGLLVALSFLGDPTAAAALGGAIFLVGVVIHLASRRGLPEESRPTQFGTHAATLAVLAAMPLVLTFQGIWHPHEHDYVSVRAVVLSMAAGMAVIYLSSLVDRFFLRPRLSNRDRACLTSLEGRWRANTQIWLLHRLAAFLAFRLAVAVSLAFVATAVLHNPSDATKSAIAGVVLFVVGYYISRITPIATLAINPPMYVGDKVVLAEEYTAASAHSGYFVVDVALEGFKLLEVDEFDVLLHKDDRRMHDRLLPITDVPRLLRSRHRFDGCRASDQGCGEINPYCPIYKSRVAEEARSHLVHTMIGKERRELGD